LPPVKPELKSFHTVLLVLSVVIAALGLAGAAWFYARNGARAERARLQMQPLHRLLSGKYYIDELYEALIGRPIAGFPTACSCALVTDCCSMAR